MVRASTIEEPSRRVDPSPVNHGWRDGDYSPGASRGSAPAEHHSGEQACVDMGAYGKPPENLQEEQACFLAQLPSPNAPTSCFALSGSSVTLASSSQHRPTK